MIILLCKTLGLLNILYLYLTIFNWVHLFNSDCTVKLRLVQLVHCAALTPATLSEGALCVCGRSRRRCASRRWYPVWPPPHSPRSPWPPASPHRWSAPRCITPPSWRHPQVSSKSLTKYYSVRLYAYNVYVTVMASLEVRRTELGIFLIYLYFMFCFI